MPAALRDAYPLASGTDAGTHRTLSGSTVPAALRDAYPLASGTDAGTHRTLSGSTVPAALRDGRQGTRGYQ